MKLKLTVSRSVHLSLLLCLLFITNSKVRRQRIPNDGRVLLDTTLFLGIILQMTEQKKTSLIDYVEVIIKWRFFIIRGVLCLTIIAAVISFLLRAQYTATVTIMPPNIEQQSMLGLMSTYMQGGLSELASMGGALQGLATPSDLFAAIMKSGRIRNRIIEKYNLKKIFNVKTTIEASEALDDITRIIIAPEGIVSVSVRHHDKYLASNIATSFIEELDKFNTETAMTMGKKYRIFIEDRLKETKDSLIASEEALRDFQSRHRTIVMQEEIKSAIESVSQLKSQIIMLEVKRNVMAASAQLNNPFLQSTNRELEELKRQLADIEFDTKNRNGFGAGFSMAFAQLPELSLEYARLLRNVKVQEAVFELLTQQYEQAKIMEAKDTPTVQVLDPAGPPEKRSFPNRRKIVTLVFLVSIIANVGLVFFLERYNIARKRKDVELSRWTAVFDRLRKDFSATLGWLRRFFKWKR